MRGSVVVVASALALAGCKNEGRSLAQKVADDERAIAEVQAAQTPPPDVVSPQRITAEERARYKLTDSGCNFAVNNPELGPQAILQMNVGYMKFEGNMERFAPDAGAGDGPAGVSTQYDGGTHGLTISFDMTKAASADGGMQAIPAKMTLQDGRRRTVYVAEGTALCRLA